MIKVFQICVGGVETDRFYEGHTAEEAMEDYKKDCIEEYGKTDMRAFDGVEAILYDIYED